MSNKEDNYQSINQGKTNLVDFKTSIPDKKTFLKLGLSFIASLPAAVGLGYVEAVFIGIIFCALPSGYCSRGDFFGLWMFIFIFWPIASILTFSVIFVRKYKQLDMQTYTYLYWIFAFVFFFISLYFLFQISNWVKF